MTKMQKELIASIKRHDAAIREELGIPMPRVSFTKLSEQKTNTLKKVERWYQELITRPEISAFYRIQSENPMEYWNRITGQNLPEAKEYRKCKKAVQDLFRSTMPKCLEKSNAAAKNKNEP